MADKIAVMNEKKVSLEGTFDIVETYKLLRYYLEKSRHYDLSEKDYTEKNSGGKHEIVSFVEAEQEFSDYYKIVIGYKLELQGNEVEANINGKIKKLTKGKGKLVINAWIVPDHLEKRNTGALMTFVSKVYDKYFGKEEFLEVAKGMGNDTSGLINTFKKQFNSIIK